MPKVSQTTGFDESEYFPIGARGPVAQFFPAEVPPTPLAATGGGATWTSDVIPTDGFKAVAAGVTAARAGTLAITRYIDEAGLVLLDVTSVVLAAAVPNAVAINDGKAFGSFKIVITNTDSAGTSALTNFACQMQAA
jgi:hypothetical protein